MAPSNIFFFFDWLLRPLRYCLWNIGEVGRPGTGGLQGPKGDKGRDAGGVKYVRWGRTTCPSGADIVYKGEVGLQTNFSRQTEVRQSGRIILNKLCSNVYECAGI